MKILKIRILNLNSLQLKTEIDFTQTPISDSGLFAITGDTGSGKTTILDAITLALYGRLHRNKDVKEVLSYGATECYAEVEFESRANIYLSKWSLWRARGKVDGNILGPTREIHQFDHKAHEFKLLTSRKSEVDELVSSVTGLDYNRFTRSVLLCQGDFSAFLKASEKDRSDLLERITGTEIYSTISKAAYQKYKEENIRLEQLQFQQTTLNLLPKEELEELEKQVSDFELDSKKIKGSISEYQQLISSYKRISELEKRATALAEKEAQLLTQQTTFQEEFQLLKKHEETIPFHGALTKYIDRTVQKEQVAKELNTVKVLLTDVEKEQKSIEILVGKEKEDLSKKKTDFVLFEKTIQQVRALDIEIQQRALPLNRLKETIAANEQDINAATKGITHDQEKLTTLSTELEQHKGWIKEHQVFENYPSLAPQIEIHKEELRSVLIEKKGVTQELTIQRELLLKAESNNKELTTSLGKIKEEEQTLVLDFEQLVPEKYSTSRSDLLQKLNLDIEKLNTGNQYLQQLKELSKEYSDLLHQQSDIEDLFENLQQEEFLLGKQILTNNEILDEIAQKVAFKSNVLEQQKMIVVYERDRNNLEDGTACPLCFSTSHPFREHQLVPFVDQAQQEYDAVVAQQDVLKNDYVELMTQYRGLITHLQHLKGNEDGSIEGQIDANLKLIKETESKIGKLAPEINSSLFSISKEAILSQKIKEFETDLQSKKASRTTLFEIDEKLKLLEKQKEVLGNQNQEADFKTKTITEEIKRLTKRIDVLEADFNATTSALNTILLSLGHQFESIEKAGSMFTTIQEKGDKFALLSKTTQSFESDKALLQQSIKNKEEQLTKQQEELAKQQKEAVQFSDKMAVLTAERTQLFGEKDVEKTVLAEKELLQNQMNTLEAAEQKAQNVALSVHTNQTKIQYLKKQSKEIDKEIDLFQEELLINISDSVFTDIEELKKAILSERTAKEIRQKRTQLDTSLLELAQAIKLNKEQLETENIAEIKATAYELAIKELPVQESALEQLQQQLGRFQLQIQQDKERKKEATSLMTKIEKQDQEVSRWAALNDVIGQADGQKFRVYAQGLTLHNLVILANRHLTNLHGRYQIYKPKNQGLYLEIIDTYQADNRRSMNTLSGGESFLISLAMALALSDMAGRATQIQSLFIDEGFGTLDEQTLDMAITTLENLQASGKIIGVISHVNALKERIGTQIQVSKAGNGRSTIEIVG